MIHCLALSRLAQLDVKWSDHYLADEGFYLHGKSNPYYQLMIVTEGPVYLLVDGEKLTLEIGDSYILLPWQQHRGWQPSPGRASFFWVQFAADPPMTPDHEWINRRDDLKKIRKKPVDLRTFSEIDEDSLLLPRKFTLTRRYEIFSIFEKLLLITRNLEEYFRFHSSLLVGEMLRLIASDYLSQNKTETSLPGSFRTYRQIVKYWNEFYAMNPTREAIEARLERKYEYLCQVFRQYSGTTMINYIHQLRVQKAKHLLLNSALNIHNIAEETGFSDPYYFSKIFKKIDGNSPLHYRRHHVN
ncbi:MAG: transcriptional regulator, AraC family [Paenibacillaceae bacterium]|nr:transcriptional regulator, AraC family [Paenibacillaceae bacterium]